MLPDQKLPVDRGPTRAGGSIVPEKRDKHLPGEKWDFNDEVAGVFDDMLERSIPGYRQMRELTFRMATTFLDPADNGEEVLDLGTSNGGALQPLIDRYGARFHYCGAEISEPMCRAFRERFGPWIEQKTVRLEKMDLRQGFPSSRPLVAQSILALQFVPIEYRQRIISDVYENLRPGGAFLVVEKVLAENADLDERLTALYYDMKREHGYSEDQIWRKRKSLEGVLVPVTAAYNVDFLYKAGFRAVDCYWRCLQFAAWVAQK